MAEIKTYDVIKNYAEDGKVALASQIWDEEQQKFQSEINIKTESSLQELYARISYYVCSTDENVSAKTIVANGYTLGNGGSIKVKMTNANTVNNATLNINSTGAKALYYQGERASATNSWNAEEVVEIYYDGTSYYANNVKGGSGSGVYDVSKEHPTSGPNSDGKFTLDYILANADTLIPTSWRHGGMTISFVHTSDNKYVQFRLTAQSFSTTVSDWQNVDDKISELALKTDNIEKEVTEETTEAVDFYSNDNTELLHHIGDDGADFKNLKSNSKKVVVEDELTDYATKESVQSIINKTNKLEEEQTQQDDEEIIIGETKENPTAKFTKDALMVKRLTDLNGNEIGSVFAVIVEGTNVTISFGGLTYELGYNSNTANNSFDFKRILIGNTEIFRNTSDILGPWWIAAVNNADGDNQTPSFTGGGHTYSGGNRTDESGTSTSTLEAILINGNKVTSYSGNAALIDIYWTNLVQAYNTKKVDGSGRAVLQENYHLSFDGSHFNVENNIELLEDVVVGRYYGMELWGANKENRTIVYEGARETSEYAGSVNSNSGDIYCFAIHRYDTNLNLEQVAEMQRIGLGEFYLDDSYSAFTVASTGKSYFNITRKPVNFSQGQRLIYKGSYTFKKL